MHTCKGPVEVGGGGALGSGARWEGVRRENTCRQRLRRGADQPGRGEGGCRHAWPSGDPPRSQRARRLQPETAGRQTEVPAWLLWCETHRGPCAFLLGVNWTLM